MGGTDDHPAAATVPIPLIWVSLPSNESDEMSHAPRLTGSMQRPLRLIDTPRLIEADSNCH